MDSEDLLFIKLITGYFVIKEVQCWRYMVSTSSQSNFWRKICWWYDFMWNYVVIGVPGWGISNVINRSLQLDLRNLDRAIKINSIERENWRCEDSVERVRPSKTCIFQLLLSNVIDDDYKKVLSQFQQVHCCMHGLYFGHEFCVWDPTWYMYVP